ncbi:MAG TPA: flagellar hook-length control protein FliK, partial [Anaerolineaceae bacterium]|nr:flagellar hook-length control protein FliK [Anaerolineaceae bacterium]
REDDALAPVVSAAPAEPEAAPARVEPAAEAARPAPAPDPAVLQAQYNPTEARAVDPRPFQVVEGKDQGVLMQMVETIQSSVQKGQSSLRLQLNPQELGSIDVRLVSNPQGVGVTVFADQASTGRLLEMQIDQLRTSLQEAGVQLAHLNVFQHGQQRQEAPADGNRRFSQRRLAAFSQHNEPAAEAVAAPRRGQSVVDYRV